MPISLEPMLSEMNRIGSELYRTGLVEAAVLQPELRVLLLIWSPSGGNIVMNPNTDVWIDVNMLEVNLLRLKDHLNLWPPLVEAEISSNEDGSRIGVSPIHWGSWETTNVNVDLGLTTNSSSSSSSGSTRYSSRICSNWSNWIQTRKFQSWNKRQRQ